MDAKAEKLALFRYGLVAPLVLETLPRGELTRRAQEVAARHYDIPDSKRISVSVDTLLDWAHRYRTGGFEALAPKLRQDRGQSRALSPQLADLIERLKLSKGSASQGLKFLRHAGAIRMVYVPGDRRVHYEAVAELRNLVARFLRDYVVPQLDSSEARLQTIAVMVKQLPGDEQARVASRITMLQSWEKRTRNFLPLVVKLLGG